MVAYLYQVGIAKTRTTCNEMNLGRLQTESLHRLHLTLYACSVSVSFDFAVRFQRRGILSRVLS